MKPGRLADLRLKFGRGGPMPGSSTPRAILLDHPTRAADLPGARFRALAQRIARKAARIVLGADRHMRIRVAQWMLTVAVYAGSGSVFATAMASGWTGATASFQGWAIFIGAALAVFYVALRSGWSARFEDAGLTSAQIVVGITAACWGYVVGGQIRSAALFALLLVLVFGAFSLRWRRIMALTAFALVALVVAIGLRHQAWQRIPPLHNGELQVDLVNLAMIAVLLPATSLVAARLSSLRRKLQAEREALETALKQVQRLATRDELTGLPNRRHMQELLDREQARFERHGHGFSVALIDLDRFKRINDLHGHAAGDAVLRSFALTAAAGLRGQDVLGRWGGEEFLLLMPDTSAGRALASVQRMLERVRHLPFMDDVALSFSAGVGEQRVGETVEHLLERVDARMYAAKDAGRGIVLVVGDA